MKKLLVVAAAGIAAAIALSGCGRGGGMKDPVRAKKYIDYRVDDYLDDLDATDAQRKKIHELKAPLVEEGFVLREANLKVRDELLTQWKTPNPDIARVHQLIDERIDAVRAVAHKAADATFQAHQTLTPAQRAEVAAQMEKARDRYSH